MGKPDDYLPPSRHRAAADPTTIKANRPCQHPRILHPTREPQRKSVARETQRCQARTGNKRRPTGLTGTNREDTPLLTGKSPGNPHTAMTATAGAIRHELEGTGAAERPDNATTGSAPDPTHRDSQCPGNAWRTHMTRPGPNTLAPKGANRTKAEYTRRKGVIENARKATIPTERRGRRCLFRNRPIGSNGQSITRCAQQGRGARSRVLPPMPLRLPESTRPNPWVMPQSDIRRAEWTPFARSPESPTTSASHLRAAR